MRCSSRGWFAALRQAFPTLLLVLPGCQGGVTGPAAEPPPPALAPQALTWSEDGAAAVLLPTTPMAPALCLLGRPAAARLREDGVWRVYAGSACGHGLLELTPTVGGWQGMSILDLGVPLYAVAAGAGRDDGQVRLYVARGDHRVDEVTYGPGRFQAAPVGALTGETNGYGLLVGPGLPPGCGGLAVAGGDGGLHCFRHARAAGWRHTRVPVSEGGLLGLAVGDGRGDGLRRLYASTDEGELFELGWSRAGGSSAAQVTLLGRAREKMCDVALLPALSGLPGPWVLGGSSDGGLYAFRWRGAGGEPAGSWAQSEIARAAAGRAFLSLLPLGDGHRVLGTESSHRPAPDHLLHELTRTDRGWQDRIVARLGMMARLLYVPVAGGRVLAFTDEGRTLTVIDPGEPASAADARWRAGTFPLRLETHPGTGREQAP